MLFSFLVILLPVHGISAKPPFCTTTTECIDKVKRIVPDSGRFWFGDQWRLHCSGSSGSRFRMQNPISCLNPRELSNFHSLGSRLFRAQTFTAAYLQYLKIYPRIKYETEPGSYRACDHNFDIQPDVGIIHAHPEMDPVDPFLIRNHPDIEWPELSDNDTLIIVMLDGGFGTLKFMSINFPVNTQVVRKYEPVENFRMSQPTPFVLLVFKPPPGVRFQPRDFRFDKDDELFDLSEFMMKYHLERSLIGLNWIMVGADAYAIEKQRIKGIVDNCHSLVIKKLIRDKRWNFVDSFPLNEMDAWLSASYRQPERSYDVCCTRVDLSDETLFLDPLDDGPIPSVAVFQPPKITSLRSIQQPADNYQRSLRHYIAMKEDKFTLLMFDPKRAYMHWLLVDIPSGSLASGNIAEEALQVASYVPPIPEKPNDCYTLLFMLFRQPRTSQSMSEIAEFYNTDHPLRSRYCMQHCIYRGAFDVSQFKSFHRLTLSATSWMKVCYDIHEAARQIKIIKEANMTDEIPKNAFQNGQKWDNKPQPSVWYKDKEVKSRKKHDIKTSQIDAICSSIKKPEDKCTSRNRSPPSSWPISIYALILVLMSVLCSFRA